MRNINLFRLDIPLKTLVYLIEKLVYLGSGSFNQYFHTAIGQIFDPAFKPKVCGKTARRITKTNALNRSCKINMDPDHI